MKKKNLILFTIISFFVQHLNGQNSFEKPKFSYGAHSRLINYNNISINAYVNPNINIGYFFSNDLGSFLNFYYSNDNHLLIGPKNRNSNYKISHYVGVGPSLRYYFAKKIFINPLVTPILSINLKNDLDFEYGLGIGKTTNSNNKVIFEYKIEYIRNKLVGVVNKNFVHFSIGFQVF